MKSLSVLDWSFAESSNCTAQAIVTNGTDHVWLSCTSYLAHGRLIMEQKNGGAVPIRIELDQFNYQALDGPQQSTGSEYMHISDGEYNNGELWFGIEGGNRPRVLPGAVVRYNADTLEYIDIYPHPYIRTMPWLVVDSKRQRILSCNWTDSNNELNIFDIPTLQWKTQNLTVSNVPRQYSPNGIPYIQGGTMLPSGDQFLLQTDNLHSTLLLVDVQNAEAARVATTWDIGLGKEQEGIALIDNYILSLGNRYSSWEDMGSAQIVALEWQEESSRNHNDTLSPSFGWGVAMGMAVTVFSFILLRLWGCCKNQRTNKNIRDYDGVEITQTNQSNDDYDDDGML